MSYQLHITSTAEHDIMRAVDYIEFTLKNPQAADNLLDAVTKQIGTLSGSLTLTHSQNSQMSFMYGFFFVKFLIFTVVCVVIVI